MVATPAASCGRRRKGGFVTSWRWRHTLTAAALAVFAVAWLDPYATARQANQLFADGKYDEAAKKYNQALVDQPDSPLLHFNLGDAAYKQGKYADAIKAFQGVPLKDGDSKRTARVAYNIANAKYKVGEAAEASDPKTALTNYAEALVLYRRAMGIDPSDTDIKFNYEFVDKKLNDLKKKLEEQKKQQQKQQQKQQKQDQQQSQQQNQQQSQSSQDQKQAKDQQPGQQQHSAQNGQRGQQQKQSEPKQAQAQPQQGQQPNQSSEQQQAAASGAEAGGEKKNGEMSRQEAVAVLDSQRDQEVRPDEVIKKLQGAVVAQPAQDW
jgi:Ca-activated chloride channel homolog